MSVYRIESQITGESCVYDTLDECRDCFGVTEDNYNDFRLFEECRENTVELDIAEAFNFNNKEVEVTEFENTVFQKYCSILSRFVELHKRDGDTDETKKAMDDVQLYLDFFKKFFDLDIREKFFGK